MSKICRKLTLFLIFTPFLSPTAFPQDLPCGAGPKPIRAYSLANSNSICLLWPTNYYRQELHVFRRVYTNRPSQWQYYSEIYAITNPVLAQAASQYCDTNVSSGIHYEYQISALIATNACNVTTDIPYWYYQYISTGAGVPLRDQRGKLVLLVERSLAAPLASEIERLEDDLIGDGYQLFRHDVAASDVTAADWKTNVASTKALVRADYKTDTNADWSIFILGHVPIPYSGLNSPGSHTENYGAHPSDWYYADMDESLWTDTTANDTTALYPSDWNVPGDGKFDQSFIPSPPELRIGRVDLVNMPAFGKSQVELVRQYLDRNHAWRHKQFTARDRGLTITSGKPFESFNLYSSFFGSTTNYDLGLWLSAATNSESSYMFAASWGSGSFTEDHQIGSTEDFAATHLYAVFTSLFGSYYGDWDSAMHSNVVILAPLASDGYTVSTYYHENVMCVDSTAMDEAIGYELYAMAAREFASSGKRYNAWAQVHPELGGAVFVINEPVKQYNTLMGDPTLRLRIVVPPTNVTVSIGGADNVLSWTSAVDTNIQGYHVYRAPMTNQNGFTRINTRSEEHTSE